MLIIIKIFIKLLLIGEFVDCKIKIWWLWIDFLILIWILLLENWWIVDWFSGILIVWDIFFVSFLFDDSVNNFKLE